MFFVLSDDVSTLVVSKERAMDGGIIIFIDIMMMRTMEISVKMNRCKEKEDGRKGKVKRNRRGEKRRFNKKKIPQGKNQERKRETCLTISCRMKESHESENNN